MLTMHRGTGLAVALGLFGILVYPARYLDLLVLRELFGAAVAIGWLPAGGPSYWEEIMGRDIPLHSDLFHATVRFLAAIIAFAPVLLLTLTFYERIAFRCAARGPTRCRRCGGELRNLVEPICDACGTRI